MSHLILLTVIIESSWAKIFLSLSTFALRLKYIVPFWCHLHLCVLSKYRANLKPHISMSTVNVCHSCYSQDKNIAQGRQWHCCSLVICLGVSRSQRRIRLDSICLSELSHLFPLAIYFIIMFSSFSTVYITESPFYSNCFYLTLILTMDLSLGTSSENLEESTVLFMIHNFLKNQNSKT